MSNYTIDASLEVEAGSPFPEIFPIYFGPLASVVKENLFNLVGHSALGMTVANAASAVRHIVADASLNINASQTSGAGKAHFAEASLLLNTTSAPFPYIFPFVFDNPTDVMSLGQLFGVDLDITANEAAEVTYNQFLSASQHITTGFTAALLQGLEKVCDSELAASATLGASATRNVHANAVLAAEIERGNISFHVDGSADAPLATRIFPGLFPYKLPFTFGQKPAAISWTAGAFVDLNATVETTGGVSMDALIDNVFAAVADSHPFLSHGQSIDAVETAGVVSTASEAAAGILFGADLSIQAIVASSLPTATGFWPFFLR